MKRLATSLMILAMLGMPALSSAATFSRSLAVGSRGSDVAALQQTLFMFGFLKVSATGYFGVLTKAAVIAFQKENGIDPIGIYGPKTRAQLLSKLISYQSASVPTPQPPTLPPATVIVPPTPPILSLAPPTSTTPSAESASTTTSNTATSTPPADANAFTITLVSPTSTLPRNTLYTTLVVATNKNATCRWGTNPDMSFGYMTPFQETSGTTHSYYFSSVASGSLYVYYIKCEDAATFVISPDTTVSFSVSS